MSRSLQPHAPSALGQLETRARWLARRAQPWPDWLARVGYLAKGSVYLLVGGIALAAAFGEGTARDPHEALATVGAAPAGRLALALIAAGMVAHALFRVALVLFDEPWGQPGRWRSIGRRTKNGASAFVSAGLAISAAGLALGWRALRPEDHDAQAQDWSARLLALPHGQAWLLAVAGVMFATAAFQIIRATGRNDICRNLRTEDMTGRQRRWLPLLGRTAYLGRAAVLLSIATYVARAALEGTPEAARGPGGALRATAGEPYGGVLLAFVAAGLIAFGAYALLEARWRRLLPR